jgi:predicted GIY-YIG superfamily endonuclease
MSNILDEINIYLQNISNTRSQLNYMKRILELTDNEDVANETIKQFNIIRYNYEQLPYFPIGTDYIYVWELEEQKYYVGTSGNILQRLKQHSSNNGAKWTQKYKPVKIIEVCLGNKEVENKKTIEYMKLYGWENVRGGSWCVINMKGPPNELKIVDDKLIPKITDISDCLLRDDT